MKTRKKSDNKTYNYLNKFSLKKKTKKNRNNNTKYTNIINSKNKCINNNTNNNTNNTNNNTNNNNRSDFYPKKNDISHLQNEYENRLIELYTKQIKFKTSLRECLKWKKNFNRNFLALKTFNIPNNKCDYNTLKLKIKYIENIISKINTEHLLILAFSEVCYRSKYGLLHTLPKKKLKIIGNIFPNIQNAMMKSKMNYKPQTKMILPKKQSIRFGKVYIRKFI